MFAGVFGGTAFCEGVVAGAAFEGFEGGGVDDFPGVIAAFGAFGGGGHVCESAGSSWDGWCEV